MCGGNSPTVGACVRLVRAAAAAAVAAAFTPAPARAARCRRRRARARGAPATRRSAASAQRAAAGLEHAPALERGEQPRRHLRVLRIERQHGVDDEIVARAVGAVELLLVRQREGVHQRAHAVGIGEREGRVRGQRLDAIERRRLRNGGLQREPFVDDQRVAARSARRNRRARRSAPARRAATAPPARPCDRSCCRRSCIAAPRARWRRCVRSPPADRGRCCARRAGPVPAASGR